MKVPSKRMRLIKDSLSSQPSYPLKTAIQSLQGLQPLKFVESVEATIHLAVNQKKSDQVVRGSVVLPNGTGRKTRVIVVTQSKEQRDAVLQEGATRSGLDDVVNDIKNGQIKLNERDTIIATPFAMKLLMPLGPLLGPKGLMPNPKLGTVTEDPVTAVRHAILGQVQYRTDKIGVIRSLVGKVSLSAEQLVENIQALLASIIKNKPEAVTKGRGLIKKVTLSSTMGPGLCIDLGSLPLDTVL